MICKCDRCEVGDLEGLSDECDSGCGGGQHGQNIYLVRERRIVVMILKAIVQLRAVLHNTISVESSRTTTIDHRIAKFYDHR